MASGTVAHVARTVAKAWALGVVAHSNGCWKSSEGARARGVKRAFADGAVLRSAGLRELLPLTATRGACRVDRVYQCVEWNPKGGHEGMTGKQEMGIGWRRHPLENRE